MQQNFHWKNNDKIQLICIWILKLKPYIHNTFDIELPGSLTEKTVNSWIILTSQTDLHVKKKSKKIRNKNINQELNIFCHFSPLAT